MTMPVYLKRRLVAVYGVLAVLNLGSWVCAFIAFVDRPVLLSIALMVYGLGLRHAIDVDHIAAIDNVTRKLVQENERPVAVGFHFAMGHSTVVAIMVAVIAGAATLLGRFEGIKLIGGTISTVVSGSFLLAIAGMNAAIFFSIHRAYRSFHSGTYEAGQLDVLLNGTGLLVRVFRPLFRLVTKSWHMFPLGLLFGLGFDTATEVAMFGMAASQATSGLSLRSILILPALFAAGMALIDTTDGVMMLAAYEWAFVKPLRKLYYNMTITLVSALVALLIGSIEILRFVGERLDLRGILWRSVDTLGNNLNVIGYAVVVVLLGAWAFSYMSYGRYSRQDLGVQGERPDNPARSHSG